MGSLSCAEDVSVFTGVGVGEGSVGTEDGMGDGSVGTEEGSGDGTEEEAGPGDGVVSAQNCEVQAEILH